MMRFTWFVMLEKKFSFLHCVASCHCTTLSLSLTAPHANKWFFELPLCPMKNEHIDSSSWLSLIQFSIFQHTLQKILSAWDMGHAWNNTNCCSDCNCKAHQRQYFLQTNCLCTVCILSNSPSNKAKWLLKKVLRNQQHHIFLSCFGPHKCDWKHVKANRSKSSNWEG